MELVREIGLESVDWIHLSKDRDWCSLLVNFLFHKRQHRSTIIF
jgi:hypothetical protein